MTPQDLAVEAAAQMLADKGIPATLDTIAPMIIIKDDGYIWYFSSHDSGSPTWTGNLYRRPSDYFIAGHAVTDVPFDSDDPFAISGAIIAALTTMTGVTIWPED